jgi:hypothetical protein
VTAYARVAILAIVAACHRDGPSPRERALSRLPGASQILVAADGAALADPAIRRVIDVARPRIPASFGCVVDAALSSQAAALSADRTGIAIAIVTHADVPRCPALSKVAPDVWVATVGEPGLPARGDVTALTAPEVKRARDYLLHAPIAFVGERGQARLVGTASPDPIGAWLAIDAPAPITIALDPAIGAVLARAGVLGKIDVRRTATQLVYTAKGMKGRDLEQLAHDVVALFDPAPTQPPERIACPPIEGDVLACSEGPRLQVRSVPAAVIRFITAPREVAVVNGDVVGMRLGANPPQFLRKGDIVVAVDSRRVRSDAELAALIHKIRARATLIVRRGTEDNVIELEE